MIKKSTRTLMQKLRATPGLDWVVLGLGLVVFVLLVLHSITASSIWFDEAFSAYISQFSFFDIARYTATDVHPPLYYWILKIWTDFFGTTELAFRSLSLLFGTTTIAAGFMLVRRLFGRHAAWVSLLLLTLSPMLIRYSEEARMYTLAATIALTATYVLTRAVETKNRRLWVLYGILISLGMWTHYFTALVWLAHWAWRAIVVRQTGVRGTKFRSAFFSRDWIIAHVVAIGMFLPWLPFMAIQLGGIQGTGFWIGPLTADSLTNYLTNVLFYLQHDQVLGWFAVVFIAVIIMLGVFGFKLYRSFNKKQRQNYLLLIAVAFVPVLLLFIASLPPLKSSFVERYLIPSAAGFALFAGVTLTLGMTKIKFVWRVTAIGLLTVSMLFGIFNVYYYGNYNKNSNVSIKTGDVVKEIAARAQPGEPIVADTPWVFYEAVFYSSASHPVYFADANTAYIYGSLNMLKDNDQHKIKDLTAFSKANPFVWVVSGDPQKPVPDTAWKVVQQFSVHDPITDKDVYKAVQYKTN
jgi:mannosyltransferase